MQDYKSLYVAVMISATRVNTHTHTHANTQRDSFLPAILGQQLKLRSIWPQRTALYRKASVLLINSAVRKPPEAGNA